MMYKIAISILSTMIPCMIFANTNDHNAKRPIERVVHIGNMTQNTYQISIKDAHGKLHEPAILPPGCTQYMYSRTEKISSISFQPCKPIGKQFQIHKPISEMLRIDCNDHTSLAHNFHFYLFPDNTIRGFPAASPKDLEIIQQVNDHTFVVPSEAFTSPFEKKS